MYSEPVGRTSSEMPFWPSLTEAEQQALNASAERATYQAGTVLCSEAEPATHVIVIQTGWTKVCLTRGSRRRIIALRGPGDLVGERAVLRVRSRSATVVVLDSVEALIVPAERFATFLDDHDRVRALLERQIYGRLTETPRRPADSDISIEEWIARHIVDIALPCGGPDRRLTLPVTRQEFADWLDTPRPDVERVLLSWERNGIARSRPHGLTILDGAALERLGGRTPQTRGTTHVAWEGQNCSVLFTDVVSFSDDARTEGDRRTVRQVMYEILEGAFEDSRLPWAQCHSEDRGDGTLVVVPPSVVTSSLVDPLLSHLGVRLDAYNRGADDAVRIQFKVALDVGPVTRDPKGVAGDAIIQAARMLEARDFKDELKDTGADLGFIASSFVYDSAVKHRRSAAPPDTYRQVTVKVKETETTAWMFLAHGARPLRTRPRVSPAVTPASPASTGGTSFDSVEVQGDFVMGNKIQYGR